MSSATWIHWKWSTFKEQHVILTIPEDRRKFRHDSVEQLVYALNQSVDYVFVVSNLVLTFRMMVQNFSKVDWFSILFLGQHRALLPQIEKVVEFLTFYFSKNAFLTGFADKKTIRERLVGRYTTKTSCIWENMASCGEIIYPVIGQIQSVLASSSPPTMIKII